MTSPAEKEGRLVPVDFTSGSEIPAVHANQVIIQHTEHEFIITLYEVLPPTVNSDPALQARQLAKIKSVPARAVAKIVMSPGRVRELSAALADNIEKYDERMKSLAESQVP